MLKTTADPDPDPDPPVRVLSDVTQHPAQTALTRDAPSSLLEASMMLRPATLWFALVVVAACGGRFAGEPSEDAGSVDSEPVVDASRAQDAGETRDAIAPEADANKHDVQVPFCPSGEATCSDIYLCVKQIAASPPQGVVATDQADATDAIRQLLVGSSSSLSAPQILSGSGEFVGGDGHPYAFARIPDPDVWVIVNGDVAPAVYNVVVQYIQCGCAQGRCEPQDAAAAD